MDSGVVMFAINPKQLNRFRDRLSPAGAKDDGRDALVWLKTIKRRMYGLANLDLLERRFLLAA